MRGFFLLLLLTNVAFVAWQYFQADGPVQVDPYRGISFDDKGLTLLNELPPAKRPALRNGEEGAGKSPTAKSDVASAREAEAHRGSEETGSDKAIAARGTCYRLSAIGERELLDKVLGRLKRVGATAIEEGSSQGQKTNYWVMLPPYSSRDKATEAAAILKQQRIRDFFIVRSGEYENAVSLGVFSTRDRAERRYRQVAELKARLRKPKIEAIQLPAKRYWVTYELTDSAQQKVLSDMMEGLSLKQSEEIDCK